MSVKIICKNCQKEFTVIDRRKNTAKFCCVECANEYRRKNKKLNCTCTTCGKKFYMEPYQMKRYDRNFGFFCSKKCVNEYRKTAMKGNGNHQWGLKGELNSTFKRGLLTRRNNHLQEVWISCPERPDVCYKSTRMTLHRYNVVTNWEKFHPILFDEVNQFHVLKNGLQVHHIDLNHSNNELINLTVLSKKQHTAVHNQIKILAEELTSKIIGVLKQGELLENPEVDNQQPSLNSNVLEGSETNVRVLTDSAVDSNNDTSALLYQITKMVNDYIVQARKITQDGYEETIKEILESEIKSSELIQNEL